MALSRLKRRRGSSAPVEGLESRVLFAVATVTTTADSGAGSLRQAILTATLAETSGAGSTSEFSAAVRVFDRFAVGRRGEYGEGAAAEAEPVAPASVATPASQLDRRAPRRLLYEA